MAWRCSKCETSNADGLSECEVCGHSPCVPVPVKSRYDTSTVKPAPRDTPSASPKKNIWSIIGTGFLRFITVIRAIGWFLFVVLMSVAGIVIGIIGFTKGTEELWAKIGMLAFGIAMGAYGIYIIKQMKKGEWDSIYPES